MPAPDYAGRSLIIDEQLPGKIGINNKMPVKTRDDLSVAYTPGVARPCEVIAKDPSRAKRNSSFLPIVPIAREVFMMS
jgi:malate dehydrogenase (oxaloacetate-decarboxylating)